LQSPGSLTSSHGKDAPSKGKARTAAPRPVSSASSRNRQVYKRFAAEVYAIDG